MSPLHLLWIIPVCVWFGFGLGLCALLVAAKDDVQENDPPSTMPPSGRPPAEFTP